MCIKFIGTPPYVPNSATISFGVHSGRVTFDHERRFQISLTVLSLTWKWVASLRTSLAQGTKVPSSSERIGRRSKIAITTSGASWQRRLRWATGVEKSSLRSSVFEVMWPSAFTLGSRVASHWLFRSALHAGGHLGGCGGAGAPKRLQRCSHYRHALAQPAAHWEGRRCRGDLQWRRGGVGNCD